MTKTQNEDLEHEITSLHGESVTGNFTSQAAGDLKTPSPSYNNGFNFLLTPDPQVPSELHATLLPLLFMTYSGISNHVLFSCDTGA